MADRLVGPRGLGWARGLGSSGGASVGLFWAVGVAARLGRGRRWAQALARAVPGAVALWAALTALAHLGAVVLMARRAPVV